MNSTTRAITYAHLEQVLTQIGFVAQQTDGTYRLFTYRSPEVLLVLPPGRDGDTVDAAHLLAVRKHVLENGLLEGATFDTLLWGVQPAAASH